MTVLRITLDHKHALPSRIAIAQGPTLPRNPRFARECNQCALGISCAVFRPRFAPLFCDWPLRFFCSSRVDKRVTGPGALEHTKPVLQLALRQSSNTKWAVASRPTTGCALKILVMQSCVPAPERLAAARNHRRRAKHEKGGFGVHSSIDPCWVATGPKRAAL